MRRLGEGAHLYLYLGGKRVESFAADVVVLFQEEYEYRDEEEEEDYEEHKMVYQR